MAPISKQVTALEYGERLALGEAELSFLRQRVMCWAVRRLY